MLQSQQPARLPARPRPAPKVREHDHRENHAHIGYDAMSNGRAEAITAYEKPWAYVVLTKPDVTFLVVITTVAGFYLGSAGPLDWTRLMHTLFGTTLVGAGTAALNQYIERGMDAVMRRTASRPLPSGLLQPADALRFGVVLAVAGAVW